MGVAPVAGSKYEDAGLATANHRPQGHCAAQWHPSYCQPRTPLTSHQQCGRDADRPLRDVGQLTVNKVRFTVTSALTTRPKTPLTPCRTAGFVGHKSVIREARHTPSREGPGMESRRFEVLPGSVGNHLAASVCKYALKRGGRLDDPDSGRCDAPTRQKPDDGKHGRQRRISLNIHVSSPNSVLNPRSRLYGVGWLPCMRTRVWLPGGRTRAPVIDGVRYSAWPRSYPPLLPLPPSER